MYQKSLLFWVEDSNIFVFEEIRLLKSEVNRINKEILRLADLKSELKVRIGELSDNINDLSLDSLY